MSLTACGGPTSKPAATWSTRTASPTVSAPATSPSTPAAPPSATAGAGPGEHAPAGFVALSDVDPTIMQDIRYATDHNFVGRPIDGYVEPLCILTRQAAEALHRVQTAARAHGYGVKVYDCYRPQRAVDDFVRWSRRFDEQKTKAEFYPKLDKSELFNQGYIAGPTTHSSGSTIDLTLVALPAHTQRPYVDGEQLLPCSAPADQRFPDNSADMGTGFDCFDSLAHTLDPRITGPAMEHRLLLKQLMQDAGFKNYSSEWWHYSLTQEPYPRKYFDFPVARGAVS
ncbi:M15 family metallopeptidase [Planosporangium flavigriseum]|nr:M15 family metallopeptidase [Planosporangium flavigriseum]NJC65877.1 M15 family metallopeptidase [Planosporangium flavigriseum]